MKNSYLTLLLIIVLNLLSMSVFAQVSPSEEYDACVLKQFSEAQEDLTIAEIKALCNQRLDEVKTETNQADKDEELGVISQRLERSAKHGITLLS